MKIIISPAKSIKYDPLVHNVDLTKVYFMDEAEKLVSKLQKMSSEKIAKLMHLSTDLADLNYGRYQNWETPDKHNQSNFPAIAGFNGEVYKGLDVHSMSEAQLNKTQDVVRILSGLYGILKPLDLICPYRLEMGTKWDFSPKIKNLYHFWGDKIVTYLNNEMGKEEVLINLASSEYFKVIPFKKLNAKVITPHFKDFKNGQLKIVMMYAKHQRGAMARYIVEQEISDCNDLKLYNKDGYSFDINNSTDTDWVFTR